MRLSLSLADFTRLDDEIHARAVEVAKIALDCDHWAKEMVTVPVVQGYPVSVTAQCVDVAIGRNGTDDLVLVRCPAVVFEAGSPADLKRWIEAENAAKLRELDMNMEARRQHQRSQELAILQELMLRYPAEADLLAAGGSDV